MSGLALASGGEAADAGPVSVVPGGLDEEPSNVTVAGLGDGAALLPATRGMFTGNQAQEGHESARGWEAHELVAEHTSPHGHHEVVVLERNCGATTGFSTQASLLATDDGMPSASGNLFVADIDHGKAPAARWGGPELDVEWQGPKALLLRYDSRARVFVRSSMVEGIAVRYAAIGR